MFLRGVFCWVFLVGHRNVHSRRQIFVSLPGAIHILDLDVTSDASLAAAAAETRRLLSGGGGGLFCLVNNAAVLTFAPA